MLPCNSRRPTTVATMALVASFACLVSACGGGGQDAPVKTPVDTAKTEPAKTPAAAEKPVEAAPKPEDKSAPAAETPKKPAGPKEKFALPNVKFDVDAESRKVSLGGKALTAEACLLDTSAPDMTHEWFNQAIRGLVAAKDGSLYVLDHEQKVRHYLVEPGETCKLALDPSFGAHGVFTLPTPADSISILDDGTIAAYTLGKLMRIQGGKVDSLNCSVKSVNGGGKTGFNFFGSEAEKVEIGTECKATSWKFAGWPTGEKGASVQFIQEMGKDVLVAASIEGTHYVAIHGADGKLKIKVGKDREKDKAKDEELICWARDAKPCAAGLCIVDSNCRKMTAYDVKKGTLVGSIEIGNLLGLHYPWPSALVVGKGVSWIAASNKLVRPADAPKDAPDVNVGLIFRVKGLD